MYLFLILYFIVGSHSFKSIDCVAGNTTVAWAAQELCQQVTIPIGVKLR